jgi:hypothetical protein
MRSYSASDLALRPRQERKELMAIAVSDESVNDNSVRLTTALRERHLVFVFRQRMRAFHRRFTSLRGQFGRDALAHQHRLYFRKPPRDRRDAAQHDARAAANLLIHFEHDCRADHGVRPSLAIQHLVIRTAHVPGRAAGS